MDLFSEVYGCYYTVIARVLEQAQKGMTRGEIEKFVSDNAFYDSAFHMLPKLFSGEWNLLENKQGMFYSKIKSTTIKRPLTTLEKSWLKSLISDERIKLFISQGELNVLEKEFEHISPLFNQNDFHIFDNANDGDPYSNVEYKKNFNKILNACNTMQPIIIDYENRKKERLNIHIIPYKINYSMRDDKFRLYGVLIENNKKIKTILNFARIISVEESNVFIEPNFNIEKFYKCTANNSFILFEVSKERNALERCMLQFASWEKQTEYDNEKDCYICKLYYDKQEETELLIRILSFGPVIRVIEPKSFLEQIKERIYKQFELNNRIE